MRTVKIAELKDRLSEHLRAVEQGAEVLVTDRNRPVARIVPIASERPTVTLVAPKTPFTAIRSKKRRPARWSLRSLELLSEERQER